MRRPTARIRDVEARLTAVAELIDMLTRDVSKLTSDDRLMARHFAALGLARSLRLLTGMQFLIANDFGDLCGAHGRTIIENYALSMYSLYGGDEAYEHIRGAHVRQVKALPAIPEFEEARQLGDRWARATDKIKWEDLITRTLPPLVPDGRTPAGAKWFDGLYNVGYRSYSNHDVHAGVLSIANHLLRDGSRVGVNLRRYEPDDGAHHLIYCGTIVGYHASAVYDAFGFDGSRPLRLTLAVGGDMSDEDLIIEGDWSD